MKCLGFIFRHAKRTKMNAIQILNWKITSHLALMQPHHLSLTVSNISVFMRFCVCVCECLHCACDGFIHIVLNTLFNPTVWIVSIHPFGVCLALCFPLNVFRCLIFKYYFAIFCSSFFLFLFLACFRVYACAYIYTCIISYVRVPNSRHLLDWNVWCSHANRFSALCNLFELKGLNKLSVFSGTYLRIFHCSMWTK